MVICDKCDFFVLLLNVYIVLPWNTLVLGLSLSVLFLSYLLHLCLEISWSTPQFNKIEDGEESGRKSRS